MLVAEAALEELEHVEGLRAERVRIEQAHLNRIAMWSEDGLAPIERRWQQRLEKHSPPRNPAAAAWVAAFRRAESKGTWRHQS